MRPELVGQGQITQEDLAGLATVRLPPRRTRIPAHRLRFALGDGARASTDWWSDANDGWWPAPAPGACAAGFCIGALREGDDRSCGTGNGAGVSGIGEPGDYICCEPLHLAGGSRHAGAAPFGGTPLSL